MSQRHNEDTRTFNITSIGQCIFLNIPNGYELTPNTWIDLQYWNESDEGWEDMASCKSGTKDEQFYIYKSVTQTSTYVKACYDGDKRFIISDMRGNSSLVTSGLIRFSYTIQKGDDIKGICDNKVLKPISFPIKDIEFIPEQYWKNKRSTSWSITFAPGEIKHIKAYQSAYDLIDVDTELLLSDIRYDKYLGIGGYYPSAFDIDDGVSRFLVIQSISPRGLGDYIEYVEIGLKNTSSSSITISSSESSQIFPFPMIRLRYIAN